jgi:hypothetical protein
MVTEKERVWQKNYVLKIKQKSIGYYSNYTYECKCCGEDDFNKLTIDHINGGGMYHTCALKRQGWPFHKWLIDEGYPDGYQILCKRCNCIKGKKPECNCQSKVN